MVCLNQPTNVSFKELWWYDDSSIHGIIYQKSLWKSCEKLSRISPKQQNNNTSKEIFQSPEIKSGWHQERRGQHNNAVIDWEVRRTLVHKQHSELQTLLGNAEIGDSWVGKLYQWNSWYIWDNIPTCNAQRHIHLDKMQLIKDPKIWSFTKPNL